MAMEASVDIDGVAEVTATDVVGVAVETSAIKTSEVTTTKLQSYSCFNYILDRENNSIQNITSITDELPCCTHGTIEPLQDPSI